ncbi:MAG: carotenoid oxygenase family protein, partial [Acidimicrobiia bacterium]|nr:carotenoid oxygenase family protein [Acidimicrobiia bacterium]
MGYFASRHQQPPSQLRAATSDVGSKRRPRQEDPTVPDPTPVDPATVPQLQGIFAPVHDEVDGDLEVVQGKIPDDLVGTYLRNGPNPAFPPLGSFTYPLDGDGMVHRFSFADGRATYRNRYVHTPALDAELDAGRALWGGVMTPHFPGADEVGPDLADQDKEIPDIHVVRHAGRTLALPEGQLPFQLDDELATVGQSTDFDGGLTTGMCAHPGDAG